MFYTCLISPNLFSQQNTDTGWKVINKDVYKKDTSGSVVIGSVTDATEKLNVGGNVRIDGLKGFGNRILYVDETGKLRAGKPCIDPECLGDGPGGGQPDVLPPDTMKHEGGNGWNGGQGDLKSLPIFEWDHSGMNVYLKSDFDKVGIGITSPSSILHIKNAEVNTFQWISNSSNYAAGLLLDPVGYKKWIIHATGSGNTQGADKFVLYSDSVNVLQVESDGNPNKTNTYGSSSMLLEGINNSSFYLQGKTDWGLQGLRLHYLNSSPYYPGGIATIDFVGDLFAIRTTSTGQVPKFVIKKNGNVGIGTEDPAYELEVKGSGGCGVRISDIGVNSTCLEFKNQNGAWHISGPRSYEPYNRLSIFWFPNAFSSEAIISFLDNGQVQIGKPLLSVSTHFNDYKLSVNGKLVARKLVSTELNWADDEFQKETTLDDLDKEQKFTINNSHLSGIPSAEEILKNGVEIGEMSALQMREIEKIYKYLFLLKKENEMLKQKLSAFEAKIQNK